MHGGSRLCARDDVEVAAAFELICSHKARSGRSIEDAHTQAVERRSARGSARGGTHLGSDRLRNANHRLPDTARGGEDQDPFTSPKPRHDLQRIARDQERKGQTRRLIEVEEARLGSEECSGDGQSAGQGSRSDPDDLLADLEITGRIRNGPDDARKIPRHSMRFRSGTPGQAQSRQHVELTECRGAHFDDDNGADSGSARVFSGLDGSILYTFYGDSAGDAFGGSVAGAGDVNQDGYPDLIAGAQWDDDNGISSGSARVFSGADGAVLYTFYGDSAHDCFGVSVAGAGDVNKDGYADLIVGAHLDDDNGSNSGSARVISGLGCCPSTGQSCTVAPCESCPSIVATTSGGAPTLNNGSFALELVNAPSNLSYAILAISDTPCESPGTSYIFCDTIKVHQPLAFLAAMLFTAGVSPCTTSITVPAGIPNDPTFLGFALGVQWALSCDAGTVLGASISNCVSMVVTDT